MIHFTQKTELILWLDGHAPSRTIRRAIWNGSLELLGGFSKIPPSNYPGWIIKLTTRYGKKYLVAIICNYDKLKQYCMIIDSVPWELWDGKPGRKSIYEGDNPEKYMRLKNENNR